MYLIFYQVIYLQNKCAWIIYLFTLNTQASIYVTNCDSHPKVHFNIGLLSLRQTNVVFKTNIRFVSVRNSALKLLFFLKVHISSLYKAYLFLVAKLLLRHYLN